MQEIKQKSKYKFLLRSTKQFISIMLTLIIIFFVVIFSMFPEKATRLMNFRTFLIADTGSMEPYLHHNDFIIVRRSSINDIVVGDIISFIDTVAGSQIIITHVVVEILEEEGTRLLRTQGKTAPAPDSRLVSISGNDGTNQLVGILFFHSRIIGNIIAFVRSPIGISTVIINIVGILYIKNLIKKEKDHIKVS